MIRLKAGYSYIGSSTSTCISQRDGAVRGRTCINGCSAVTLWHEALSVFLSVPLSLTHRRFFHSFALFYCPFLDTLFFIAALFFCSTPSPTLPCCSPFSIGLNLLFFLFLFLFSFIPAFVSLYLYLASIQPLPRLTCPRLSPSCLSFCISAFSFTPVSISLHPPPSSSNQCSISTPGRGLAPASLLCTLAPAMAPSIILLGECFCSGSSERDRTMLDGV